MFKIHKVCRFESAHRLPGHPVCGKLHGHSYKVEVTVESTELDEHGFIIDFGLISSICKVYDHSGRVIEMSAERLADRILNRVHSYVWPLEMKAALQSIVVRVWETETAWAEASYYPTAVLGDVERWPDHDEFVRGMQNEPRRGKPPFRYDEHELSGTHVHPGARTITP